MLLEMIPMNDPVTAKRNFLFWENGVGLERAWRMFVPSDALETYKKKRAEKTPESKPIDIPKGSHWLMIVAGAFASAQPAIENWQETGELERKLQDHVIRFITGGKLVVYGYALPRSVNDHPVQIPADVWSGNIGWRKSTVSGNGLEFVAVRVLPKKTHDQITERDVGQFLPPPRKMIGRHSHKVVILEAYDELKANDKIAFNRPMTKFFDGLREWLCLRYPESTGPYSDLSDETIRKTVSPLFKEDKSKIQ